MHQLPTVAAAALRLSWIALFLSVVALLLIGCSGGPDQPAEGGNPDSTSAQTSPSASASSGTQQLHAEIERLERQGVLPALDRSTDIGGPDVDGNGVRDDVEARIAAFSLSDVQRRAAMQIARNQQAMLLVDPTDVQAVARLSHASVAATKCIGDTFEPERRRSYEVSRHVEAITANTPERARRYMRYAAALSGTSVAYPDGDTCEP